MIQLAQESELYAPVKQYLESIGLTVRAEVRGCDIVAYADEQSEPIIVELKKRINLPLLVQGMQRLNISRQVYVAVPFTPRSRRKHGYTWKDIAAICHKLGFGLITVRMYIRRKPKVEVWCDPPVPDEGIAPVTGRKTKSAARRSNQLRQEFFARSGDFNVGGIGGKPIMTAYRESALYMAYLLEQNGPLRVSELREQVEEPKTQRILADNHYGWFERVSRGTYAITEEGRKALEQYRDVLEVQLRQLRD